MREAKITLGGREFTIQELPTRKNAAWRARLAQVLEPALALIEAAPSLAIPTSAAEAQENPAQVTAMIGLVRQVSDLVVGGLDQVLELTLAYSPALEAQAEWLAEEAYDSEVLAAFTTVLGLAYPFGGMANALRALEKVGQSQPAT